MHDPTEIEEYLEDLRMAGFDLSAPLPVEHYLHFEVASTAQGLAEDLRREGFAVDLEPEDERDGWVAYATTGDAACDRRAPPRARAGRARRGRARRRVRGLERRWSGRTSPTRRTSTSTRSG